jgi:hypothetical protein
MSGMKNKHSRVFRWTLVILALLGILVFFQCFFPAHKITEVNYQRIQNGMSLDEVSHILGAVPGRYVMILPSDKNEFRKAILNEKIESEVLIGDPETICRRWVSEEMVIYVYFSVPTERVVMKFHATCSEGPTLSRLWGYLLSLIA